jgi:polar amino acid transport system substrate-binding protein
MSRHSHLEDTVRRFAVIATAALFVAGAAACGSSSKTADSGDTTTTVASSTTVSNTPTTLPTIDCNGTSGYVTDIGTPSDFKPVTPDTLTVVTSLPGPGFFEGSDTDPTKITSGYEYDIAKKLQEAFGLSKLVVRNENFDSIAAGTVTNFDIAFSQISITCERAQKVKFSMPYFQSNQGILVNKGDTIATIDDVKKAQWGVQTGTTATDLLNKIGTDKDPKVFQSLTDAYAALQAKQIDAVLIDTAINLGEAARSNGKFEVVGQFDQEGGPDQYGALFPKDSTNAPAVNAVLKNLADTGELSQLAKTDLTADPGTIPVIQVP